ncbi:MAG TPA: PQQ-binding-like beta-propeller repeat protein [Blastocatellia bacterium]|nr:PQQ-binding-like beta-propeller repeat protein [Blastocatellia bacterium]
MRTHGNLSQCKLFVIVLFGLAALALATVAPTSHAQNSVKTDSEWRTHGGNPAHTQYSPLKQINPANVSRLKVAWVYHTGDARADNRSQIQCNPIIVDGVLYATSPEIKVFALDAATGKELWTFDPFKAGAQASSLGANRGVTYWQSGNDRRILVCAGERLYALDARTGQPIPSFGKLGSVDLTEGLGRDIKGLFVLSNTPGAIYKDLLILGTRVNEGPGPAAPGHIRAYDVRTGKIRWIFHTIPWPGEYGYDTWPKDAWQRIGGANAWSGISVDTRRGIVFLPTGSAAFDFYGGNRKGANLFADCLLALDAATGRRLWHYQFVHHDLWDRDLPAAPVLVTLRRNGRLIDAVAQTTKQGYVFVFERSTGKPLFPITERPVPPSDLDGEAASPTQPLPVKPPPYARQTFTEADATDISPEARDAVLSRLRKTRTGRQFIPPSREGTIIFPGFDGGAEWGGAAFDPTSGRLYVNANEMAWILTMVEMAPRTPGETVYRRNCASCHGIDRRGATQQNAPALINLAGRLPREQALRIIEHGRGWMPSFGYLADDQKRDLLRYLYDEEAADVAAKTKPGEASDVPYTITGYNRFLDPQGYPAVKPPWGTLTAIDLNRGEIGWQIPLGEFAELTKRGIPITGTENYGGPIVTAGGLIFIGATKDEKFRAFDKRTGKLLWETQLPAGGYATPSTYEVNGKQYVVIACGGGKMGTKSGDAYVAFALPD